MYIKQFYICICLVIYTYIVIHTVIYTYIVRYTCIVVTFEINLKDTKDHILYNSILHKVRKQAKLIFADRNQNSGDFLGH